MTPETPNQERRTELIQIRATPDEKEMIRQDAKREQRTVSQYLIWLAHRNNEKNHR